MKKYTVFIIFILILIQDILLSQNKNSNFTFKLSPVKDNYYAGEQVYLNLNFTNNNPFKDSLMNIEYSVTNNSYFGEDKNKLIGFGVRISGDPVNAYYTIFEPYQTITFKELATYYPKKDALFYYDYPAGKFYFFYRYKSNSNFILNSDTLELNIAEPPQE